MREFREPVNKFRLKIKGKRGQAIRSRMSGAWDKKEEMGQETKCTWSWIPLFQRL